MADYTLSAKITGDSSGFEKAFAAAEKAANAFEAKMKTISSKLKGVGDALSGMGEKLTLGVTTPLALASKKMVSEASDFKENINKIDVAFGDSAKAVKDWADDATKNFGLSMNQALEATSLFGDMATSMGLTQPEASKMSTSLAGLAGDLASFKNVSIDQAMTALNGVFTGETESLKQLGIVMTETNLEEFAGGLGLVYKEMSQAEKVQLRYNYVMAMSANAQGDYARTSDGTANSMRTFQASIENLSIALGQHLLPLITPLIQKATEMVTAFANADPQMQKLVLKLGAVAAAAGPVLVILGKVVGAVGGVTGVIGKLGAGITRLGGMKSVLTGVFTAITSPVGIAIAAITALVAAFAYLMATNEDFRNSIMESVSTIMSALKPAVTAIMDVLKELGGVLMNTVSSVLQALAPVLSTIVNLIAQVIAALAPLIAQLVSSLAPIITSIVMVVSNILTALMPPLVAIINTVMAAVQALIPPIMQIIGVVVDVISTVMQVISPIISFIGEIISTIVSIIAPIIEVVAGIIGQIVSFISPLIEIFAGIFGAIFDVVGSVFGAIWGVISGVFSGIQNAWNGLTAFVGGIFDGISAAFDALVSIVKGVINGVISAINGAIWVINLIPGVNIGSIPYLAHGTDNWEGGFAYMNEGGRGELTYLPNGAQVIPHDISVRYAKEAARTNTAAGTVDMSGVLDGMVVQIVNNTTVDGTPLRETVSDYTIRKIGNQQRGVLRARGCAV